MGRAEREEEKRGRKGLTERERGRSKNAFPLSSQVLLVSSGPHVSCFLRSSHGLFPQGPHVDRAPLPLRVPSRLVTRRQRSSLSFAFCALLVSLPLCVLACSLRSSLASSGSSTSSAPLPLRVPSPSGHSRQQDLRSLRFLVCLLLSLAPSGPRLSPSGPHVSLAFLRSSHVIASLRSSRRRPPLPLRVPGGSGHSEVLALPILTRLPSVDCPWCSGKSGCPRSRDSCVSLTVLTRTPRSSACPVGLVHSDSSIRRFVPSSRLRRATPPLPLRCSGYGLVTVGGAVSRFVPFLLLLVSLASCPPGVLLPSVLTCGLLPSGPHVTMPPCGFRVKSSSLVSLRSSHVACFLRSSRRRPPLPLRVLGPRLSPSVLTCRLLPSGPHVDALRSLCVSWVLTCLHQVLTCRLLPSGPHVDALRSLCVFRVSLVKGWGQQYPRRCIQDTPCWLEVHLHERCSCWTRFFTLCPAATPRPLTPDPRAAAAARRRPPLALRRSSSFVF
ncbi:hypothetical protein WMY93_026060 [Mugilogobius chulae]|uniref:MH2 domain-containing protein n=1 Tax=Mugilogobius chulae TaxID=88201 RepID=A0AAW0MXD9_9GOBI